MTKKEALIKLADTFLRVAPDVYVSYEDRDEIRIYCLYCGIRPPASWERKVQFARRLFIEVGVPAYALDQWSEFYKFVFAMEDEST